MRPVFLRAATLLSALVPALTAQTSFFSAMLNGEQEVPPLVTTSKGWGIVKLTEPANTVVCFMHVNGYPGVAIAAHMHQGVAGVNGAILVGLNPLGTDTFVGVATLTPAEVTALKTAGMYLNLHTTVNPNGDGRGQLVRSNMTKFVANMSGAQEVPPNASTASGLAVAYLDEPNNVLLYTCTGTGFGTTVTAAHIHAAPAGVNGGVIHPLIGSVPAANFGGVFQMTAAQVATLKANGLYFNIHTTAFPGGEIRGQVGSAETAEFAGAMDGAQETPPNASAALGEVCVTLNPNNTATAIITQSGMPAPNACHIHRGAVGVAGGIVFGLTGGPNVWTGTSAVLTAAEINDCRTGLWYGNLHSVAFPGGEIRGQCRVTVRPTTYGPPGLGSAGRRPYAFTNGAPCLGTSFALRESNTIAGIPAIAILGISRETYLGIPLPLDLNLAAGTNPGNFLLTDLGTLPILGTATDAFGNASVTIPIPFSPPLRGLTIFGQFLNIDLAAPGMLSTSNGVQMTLH